MRIVAVGVLCGTLLLAPVGAARATNGGNEVGLALGSAATNLFWMPVKAVMAAGGLLTGGLVGVLTGGDVRSAYALWVPTASGDFFVTPAKFEGREPFVMFGTDYEDRPTHYRYRDDGSTIYDSVYERSGGDYRMR